MANNELTTWPERIYLQSGDEGGAPVAYDDHCREVTWCQDQIGRCDVQYVRADLVAATPAQAGPNDALPELPPLPEDPAGVCDVITSQIIGPNGVTGDVIECTDGYSADQVHAYATAYAKQAIESRILGQQGAGDAAKPDPIEQARIDGWAEGMTEAQELLADEIADTARLDFVLKRQAFICLIPGEKADSYQLMEQDEDEDYQVISGEGIMYRTTREAVDAAIAAKQAQAGDAERVL